ncbi:MAG TPA: glycosyltransferase [Mycobacteriales bacterium]|nr:glycosyltransferase [Mycobacteriales bacterium]
MKVSVVVPAFNEEAVIGDAVRRLHDFWAADPTTGAFEIVVVDDGSTDATAQRVRALDLAPVRVVQQTNSGKGAAVRAGVATTTGDVVYFIDADLPYSLDNQREAVRLISAGALAAVGSRRATGAHAAGYPMARRAFSWALKVLMRLLLGLRVSDTQCGLKAFHGPLARQLFPGLAVTGFGFDLELLVVLQRNSVDVRELPVDLQHTARTSVSLVRDSVRILANLATLKWGVVRGRYDGRLTLPAALS